MSRLKAVVGTSVFVLTALGASYVDGPPPGHTGGFGEPTCRACHFDGTFNAPEVGTRLEGVPETYAPDSAYSIKVSVARPNMGAGGFSMSSRFMSGVQAGRLLPSADGRTQVVDGDSVQYVMHTDEGTKPLAADSTSWTILWIAPGHSGSVVFHIAVNAANGDDSEFGDLIRVDSASTRLN